MTSFELAWRTATRYRVRSALAMTGVAIIGALLFDMLLLSRGLVDSFADLLNSSGFDVRVVAHEGLPVLRGPIHDAAMVAAEIEKLPEVEDVTLLRIQEAVIAGADGRAHSVTLVGTTHLGARGAWTLLRGSDLSSPEASGQACPLIVARRLATTLAVSPGAALNIRMTVPGKASALPLVACRVVGIADFAFATADESAVATTMSALETAEATRGKEEADLVLVASNANAGGAAAARATGVCGRTSTRIRMKTWSRSLPQRLRVFPAGLRRAVVGHSGVRISAGRDAADRCRPTRGSANRGAARAGHPPLPDRGHAAWESGVLVGAGGLWRSRWAARSRIGWTDSFDRCRAAGTPAFFVYNTSAIVEHARAAEPSQPSWRPSIRSGSPLAFPLLKLSGAR
jgi:hypothetical protein